MGSRLLGPQRSTAVIELCLLDGRMHSHLQTWNSVASPVMRGYVVPSSHSILFTLSVTLVIVLIIRDFVWENFGSQSVTTMWHRSHLNEPYLINASNLYGQILEWVELGRGERWTRQIYLPLLLSRCQSTSVGYIADEELKGSLPFQRYIFALLVDLLRDNNQPRYREEELLYVLRISSFGLVLSGPPCLRHHHSMRFNSHVRIVPPSWTRAHT